MELPVLGLVEDVTVIGQKGMKALALLDTGAKMSSVDVGLAAEAQLGPIIRIAVIKQASHKVHQRRLVVKARLQIGGKEFDTEVNIQDRSHMRFPVLIGRNVLSGNFVIDAQKNKELLRPVRAKV